MLFLQPEVVTTTVCISLILYCCYVLIFYNLHITICLHSTNAWQTIQLVGGPLWPGNEAVVKGDWNIEDWRVRGWICHNPVVETTVGAED